MCVRFGTSCSPLRTSGLSFVSFAVCSCVLSTTELTLSGAVFSSGTMTGASNDPISPLVFSRTTTFTENRPGGSVTDDW